MPNRFQFAAQKSPETHMSHVHVLLYGVKFNSEIDIVQLLLFDLYFIQFNYKLIHVNKQ